MILQTYHDCAAWTKLRALGYSNLVPLQSQYAFADYLLWILHAPCQHNITCMACKLASVVEILPRVLQNMHEP